MLTLHLRDKLYIPIKKGCASQINTISEMFTHEIVPYNSPCKCCQTPDMCDECINQPRIVETFFSSDDAKWLVVPRGDLQQVKQIARLLRARVLDERTDIRGLKKLKDLQWNTKKWPLFDYQLNGIKTFLHKGGCGIIHAHARSGKTVIAAGLITYLKGPALFLAHRDRLLRQFRNTMYKFTNATLLEKFHGHKLIDYINNYKKAPLSKHPPILMSSLQFFSQNPRLFAKYRDAFTITFIDECHRVAAESFSVVYNNFNPRFRCGLTATPARKDGFTPVMFDIVGPVAVEVKSKVLKCLVKVINTGHVVEDFKMWPTFLRRLANDEKRNSVIVKHAVGDIKNGRFVLIVTSRKDQMFALVDAVNSAFQKHRTDPEVAVAWYSKSDKQRGDEIAKRCATGAYKLTVATREFIKEGVDCPLWDTYYCVTPTANPYDYYQEVSRIRTPIPGKTPIVKYFLDVGSAARSCYAIADKVHKQEKFKTVGGGKQLTNDGRKPLSAMFKCAFT